MRRHAKARLIAAALCSFVALAVLPAVAGAAYAEIGLFSGPGSGDGQLSEVSAKDAAVDVDTGNLYVADAGNSRVEVFAPAADGATFLTRIDSAVLSAPSGIAIDQAANVLYVSDAGLGEVLKFSFSADPVPAFTRIETGFESPAQGGGPGEVSDFASKLAVDPNSGDLLVADNANKLIQRFGADGTFVSAFDGSNGSSAFDGPIDLAVNSTGDVYVIDANGDIANAEGTSKAVRYSGAGEYKTTLGPVGTHERVATIAVNLGDDSVFVSGDQDNVYEAGPPPFQPVLGIFDSSDLPLPAPTLNVSAQYDTVSGLAFDPAGHRLYVVLDKGVYFGTAYGSPQIQLFKEFYAPAVAIDPVGATGAEFATVTGSVDPNGLPTEWWLEYKAAGAASWRSTEPQDAGGGSSQVPVEAELTGLQPFTEYLVRISASNSDGTSTSAEEKFTTLPGRPTALTLESAAIAAGSAWLRASVNPHGLPTSFHFEYGTGTGYGARLPVGAGGNAGQGNGFSVVSRKAIDLQPGTTYHYRVIAENALGTTVGEDVTFTTRTGAEPAWAYEMVSPPQKNGGAVGTSDPAASGGAIAVSGDAIGYMSPNAFAGSVSSGFKNWYVAFRGASKWETKPVNLPFRAEPNGGGDGPILSATSEDLSKALVLSNTDPVTGELQPRRNLYLHDLRTGETTQLTPDAVTGPQDYVSTRVLTAYVVRAATPSLSHVLIAPLTEATLTADAEPSSESRPAYYVVDTATAEIEFLTSTVSTIFEAGGNFHHAENVISADGSAVYIDQGIEGLHRYDVDADEDVLVNAAEGTGAPQGEARFLDASRDGRFVFFSSGQQLLPEDANGGNDVYRYDAEAAPGSRLSLISVDAQLADGNGGLNGVGSMGISRDGGRLYFAAEGQQLVAGAPTGTGRQLYLWDEGTLKYIATDPAPPEGAADYAASRLGRNKNASIDANGNFMAVVSGPSLAPPSGGPDPCPLLGAYRCRQVYLYDAAASTPTEPDFRCASCLPAPQVTPWSAGLEQFEGNNGQFLRSPGVNVSADGTVLFATATPLLPDDLNGPGRDYDNSVVPNVLSAGQDVYTYRDGELSLVSTGRSARASYPLGISPDGRTIAFTTADRLSGWDADNSQDVYVARLGGGLPEPPPPSFECVGDACLSPPVVPNDPTPASANFAGSGNVAEPAARRCPKAKKRVKARCVKKQAKKAKSKKQKRTNAKKKGARR